MRRLLQLMNGSVGRFSRSTLGVVLIFGGLGVLGGPAGWAIAVLGLGPLALGCSGRCALELLPRA